MAQLVKLGTKANSFSCPTTGLTLPNKETVRSLSPKQARSKKVIKALRGGHLINATEKEYNKYIASAEATSSKESIEIEEEEEEEEIIYTEASLKKLKLEGILVIATSLLEDDDEETQEDLDAMTKAELSEFILAKQDEAEEEDEEE